MLQFLYLELNTIFFMLQLLYSFIFFMMLGIVQLGYLYLLQALDSVKVFICQCVTVLWQWVVDLQQCYDRFRQCFIEISSDLHFVTSILYSVKVFIASLLQCQYGSSWQSFSSLYDSVRQCLIEISSDLYFVTSICTVLKCLLVVCYSAMVVAG